MSRSGYGDYDCDSNFSFLWPSIVQRATKGKRGQSFLRELAKEMDSMPVKRLIKDALVTPEGECCTMGVVFKARGIDTKHYEEDYAGVCGEPLGIARCLAQDIAYENDEQSEKDETPEQRWIRMRKWVEDQLNPQKPTE